MPIYTLKCKRCEHSSEQGFTVSAFRAQTEQGFRFLRCGRCNRRATLEHDFVADVKTQSTHRDEYTFGANAPEDHLVGRTVTKGEAADILKRHGLVSAGKSARTQSRTNRRTITEKDILAKWGSADAKDDAPAEEKSSPAKAVVEDKQVDKTEPTQDTIVAKSWPALKAQAKRLGIKAPVGTKRPELEQLVREQIAG